MLRAIVPKCDVSEGVLARGHMVPRDGALFPHERQGACCSIAMAQIEGMGRAN